MTGSNRGPQQGGQQLSRQQESGTGSVARRQYFDPTFGFGGDIFRMSPFALLRMMTEQMDREFGGFGSTQNTGASGSSVAAWRPALEMREKDGNLVISADLPGLNEKDVNVEVADDMLVIQGERRSEHEEGQGTTHRTERSYGRFYRAVQLPDGAQADQARAEFHNGVLQITVPTQEPKSNRRQIPIQGGQIRQSATTGTTSQQSSTAQSGSTKS